MNGERAQGLKGAGKSATYGIKAEGEGILRVDGSSAGKEIRERQDGR